MSSPSKRKGNTFEREVVTQAKKFNLKAIRAYASNGMSLGEAEDVDVKIENLKGQCKRRKRIAQWLNIQYDRLKDQEKKDKKFDKINQEILDEQSK